MPVLTVIMPVYNGEKFLKESIDSVLNQTFTEFSLLVLNDNSTDSTAEILKNYKRQDSRISVITKTKNEGPANLRNEGIQIAKTDLIALLDADDIALPTRFEKQLKYLNAHPEVGVCGTWFSFFGNRKEKVVKHEVSHEALLIQFLHSSGIGNPTVMFRKSALGNLRFEQQYVPAEDYGLWSQLIYKTQFHNIPESLLKYRWHDNNISQTKEANLRKSEVLIKAKQMEQLGIPKTDPNISFYIHAVSLKRKQSSGDVIKTIHAAHDLLKRNKQLEVYNKELFKKHIDRNIKRSIRNAIGYNKAFYKFIKNDSTFFDTLKMADKIILYFKCLL
ncbi:glycosyltransferase family 2 protein [Bizionia argentinensis JUB59]|uniref:Glycosyltransferase family 2 protein n=1 Tax=Bizionia argentinensis JUB59 TaxID=1046627 RepID=G2EF52_9FLAO|nr:glycosyltransferase family 2 protein [Bizionia argentinensis]EGV42937.2 glycosyltransferase family 2 protein [Bizionia argentinensis JUB59]